MSKERKSGEDCQERGREDRSKQRPRGQMDPGWRGAHPATGCGPYCPGTP